MSIKFKAKVLLLLGVALLGLYGFSTGSCCAKHFGSSNGASRAKRVFNESEILDMLDRDNEDEMRDFWFYVIDNDDVVSLIFFFSRLEYGEKNYYYYLEDAENRNALEHAIAVGSENVARYFWELMYSRAL